MTPDLAIEPGPRLWEASAVITAPPLLTKKQVKKKSSIPKDKKVSSFFLTTSRYPSLLERFLRIHPVFAQEQSIRRVSFEFMTRELLWHGFAVSSPLFSSVSWK